MSTTANQNFAMRMVVERRLQQRARQSQEGAIGDGATVLFRIRLVPTDQAADVRFASQSPLQQEIVFSPLTLFDVVSHYKDQKLKVCVADLRLRRILPICA